MPEKKAADHYLDQIRDMGIFRHLNLEDLTELLAVSDIIRYSSGEKIISQGETGEFLFAVLDGNIDISIQDDGSEIIITKLQKGEMFGEAAIFLSEKRTANASASGSAVVLRLSRANLFIFMKSYPAAAIKILMTIISGLLHKLQKVNMELLFSKQSDIQLDDIAPLIQEIIGESDQNETTDTGIKK